MANDYNASVVINTGAAEQGIKNLDVAAGNLDKTLAALHKTLQSGQTDLDAVAKSMTEVTRANTAMIQSETARARATQAAARADRERIINEGKISEAINKTAESKAKVRKIDGQAQNNSASTQAANQRKDLEATVRMAGQTAVASARVATEQTRGAVAAANLDNATSRAAASADRAAMTNSRLADSQERARNASLGLNDSLSNSRYLLYDVGQTYTVLSAALLAIPVATGAVAIAYEKDFAQVIRTNDSLAQQTDGFKNLRDDLKDLAGQIPLTFSQFSNIATIGGQLNISGKEISSFTETVARFGAASNVGLEEAATAFGRFEQSFPDAKGQEDFFNKIGSAIAYVGVKSAATETEIIAVSNQISAAGAQFGFAAQDVVGLSGALASVRIRPEMARGAFQRIMLGLSRAADDGAESFSKFGKYTGLAAEESMALFKSDPAQFFYKYVGGIKDAIAATGSVSSVLDDIGAKNVFDKQFLLGLANGYTVFGDSMKNADKAFSEGTFLNSSTEGVFNTMDAKIQRIGNSIKNLADTLAKGALADGGGLAKIADTILNITGAAERFASANPGFTAFLNTALALGGAVGILLAFKAAQAFVLAGLVGFQQVLGKTSIAAGLTLKGNMQELAKTFIMTKGITAEAAAGMIQAQGSMRAMGAAAQATSGQVHLLNRGLQVTGSTSAVSAGAGIRGFTTGLRGAAGSLLSFVGGPVGLLLGALTIIGTSFVETGEQAAQAGEQIARGLGEGAEAGVRAAADALKNRKVGFTDGNMFGNLNKSVVEIAQQAGVSFDALVNAATKGKNAVAALTPELDRVAQSKGFKNFQDFYDNGSLTSGIGDLVFLRNAVRDIGNESDKAATGTKAADNAVKELTGSTGGAIDPASQLGKELNSLGDEAETAEEKLDKFINTVFGLANSEMASQAALQALGESLGKSVDFGPNSEGGRDNVKNFEEAIRAAIMEQQNLIDTTGKSTQQASADYIAYVDALVQEMANHGVDPTRVQALADQAKMYFATGLNNGETPTVPVKVDEAAAQETAAALPATLQNFIYAQGIPEIGVNAKTDEAQSKTLQLVYWMADITGMPYEVVLDALTNPASEKATEVYALLTSITDGTYTAPVDADTSAAITNVQNFSNWARQELANLQYAMQGLGPGGVGIDASVEKITDAKKKYAAFAPLAAGSAAPKQVKAAAPAAPKINPVTPNLGGLKDGYDKVKDAANKAGDAGKKAGQDMADGIDDATRAANDYANRLKTGLQSAFDQQYGLQKATDDYYSALNAIAKKREDEVKQIQDLIDKQKELNNERDKDMVDARKAGIEKDISVKYGEVDRAADYAQQEKEALDAAAAKQKDISANNSTIVSLQQGLNAFEGNSQAAIDNREALRNLESKMIDMVVAYANTGASVEQVRAYQQKLTAQFQVDAGQVFQNQAAINGLTGNMQRYVDTINRIPYVKPTTVTADVGGPSSGAMGAVNGFGAAADWATRNRNMVVTVDTSRWEHDWWTAVNRVGRYLDGINNMPALGPSGSHFGSGIPALASGGSVPGFAGGGQIPGKAPADLSKDNRFASVDGKGLIQVQSEEFIMQKRAVDFWGTDFMHSLNNLKMPRFAGGGSVAGGSGGGGSNGPLLVELTADNIQAILRLAERDITLFADSQQLASTVNEGNRVLASKGVS